MSMVNTTPGKLSVRNLNFYYGKFHALKNINLDITKNQVTAFIGPSGCGKSTLLRTFNKMFELYPEQRAEGEILLDGDNILTNTQDIALLRAKASEQGIAEIKQQDGRLLLTFSETDFARLSALCGDSEFKGRLLLNAGSTPYLSLRLNKGETAMKMAQTLVDKYAATAK